MINIDAPMLVLLGLLDLGSSAFARLGSSSALV